MYFKLYKGKGSYTNKAENLFLLCFCQDTFFLNSEKNKYILQKVSKVNNNENIIYFKLY